MISKCLSCGYIDHEIQLHCTQCGSFYTEIINDDEPKKIKSKTLSFIQKIKKQLERAMPTGVRHD